MPPRRRKRPSRLLAALKAVAAHWAVSFAAALLKRLPAPFVFVGVVLVCNELDRSAPRVGSYVEIVQAPSLPVEDVPTELPPEAPVDASVGKWAGKVPKSPLPGQRRAPCPRGKTEVEGSCWTLTRSRPPCPEDEYEHQGNCLLPAMASTRRPPTTLEER